MSDRFDLEQQILECWKITNDIPDMEQLGANVADMTSLACVYEYRFKRLWNTFETMCAERQFVSKRESPLTKEQVDMLWECIYDHGNGKYKGKASQAQREAAFKILEQFKEW